jgi:hypothetical protein
MKITKEWLQQEIDKISKQQQHAHEVAIASQAAVDVLKAIMARMDLPESLGQESGSSVASDTGEGA